MSNAQLELPLETRGEASSAERSGEARSAVWGNERSGPDELPRVMEQIVERGNLTRALKPVRENRGSPCGDGVTVDDLPAYLREHWSGIREQLHTGRYQPSAVQPSHTTDPRSCARRDAVARAPPRGVARTPPPACRAVPHVPIVRVARRLQLRWVTRRLVATRVAVLPREVPGIC
jgi:hypothetical protein